MKTHQYLAVLLRLFAVGAFIYALKQISTFAVVAYTGNYMGAPTSPLFFLIMAAVPTFIGVVLWMFPLLLAKKIVPKDADVPIVSEKSFSILVALLITLGLYTLFYAVADGVYWLTYLQVLFSSSELYGQAASVMQRESANMLATVVEFIVALFILLRAKSIAHFLYRVAK